MPLGGNLSVVVHRGGSHNFAQVVKNRSCLSFVKDPITALVAQDSHLRGKIDELNLVDIALYAVFGLNITYAPIGSVFNEDKAELVAPNQWDGNYFVPGRPQGMALLMSENPLRYPRPPMSLTDFW